MGMHYRRGGVSSIASVLSLPRTPTGGCNACRAVASHLLRGPLGAALQSSDATKRGRASACNNDARCRLQRSEHSDATRSRLAKHASARRDGKMVLTALHDSFVRLYRPWKTIRQFGAPAGCVRVLLQTSQGQKPQYTVSKDWPLCRRAACARLQRLQRLCYPFRHADALQLQLTACLGLSQPSQL